ncbi:MAG: stage II sporulation protein D [Erysipelotrichaceae bacterium]
MNLWIRLCCIVMIVFTAFYLWTHLETAEVIIKEKPIDENKKIANQIDDVLVSIHRSDGSLVMESLENYVVGVVSSEMPATFELEALKAQSVAARTFVKKRGYQVDDTTNSQVYKSDQQLRLQWLDQYDTKIQKIKQACYATKGEVITYKGETISAVFFSSSCGKTNDAQHYWQKETPYLVSVDSLWDEQVNDQISQNKVFSNLEFAQLLGFQNEIQTINKPLYYPSGYVKEVLIDGITFSGRMLREKLALRSSSFTIDFQQGEICIVTKGFGHGIGMSQYGAQGMALAGYHYQDILKHYYTGVEITQR